MKISLNYSNRQNKCVGEMELHIICDTWWHEHICQWN